MLANCSTGAWSLADRVMPSLMPEWARDIQAGSAWNGEGIGIRTSNDALAGVRPLVRTEARDRQIAGVPL